MAYDITGTSATSGLVVQLVKLFPGATVTRNTLPVQLIPSYPYIAINQLTVSSIAERQNHWVIDYLVNIRYHVVADPSSIPGSLQTELDTASIIFLSELEFIYFDGVPVRLTGRRTEKIDGILHFFCNISVMATRPIEPDPLQENLDINIMQS